MAVQRSTSLDPAVLDAMVDTPAAWQLQSYLRETGRDTWEEMRPFLQTGLARGGNVAESCAQALTFMSDTVPEEFVRGVLATYPLSEGVKEQLKRAYGLK